MRICGLIFVIALLACSALRAQEADTTSNEQDKAESAKPSKSEQLAINQLRAITEGVRRCPQVQKIDKDGSGCLTYAPKNVTWNIKQNYSSRSAKMGYIQLVQTTTYIPKPLETCHKKDKNCNIRNENTSALNSALEQVSPPDEYRYEFDVVQSGIEPTQAFYKHQTEPNTQWLASSFGDDCIGKSISIILSDSGKLPTASEQNIH